MFITVNDNTARDPCTENPFPRKNRPRAQGIRALCAAISYTNNMKTVTNALSEAVTKALSERILSRLRGNFPVLLLVSGGSSAAIASDVCECVSAAFLHETGKLKMLFTVGLVDERFGIPGHQDSNWRLLGEKGLIAATFTAMPILTENTASADAFEKTIARYNEFLTVASEKQKQGHLYIASLFGMGEDGHTAGILPESPASFMVGEKSAMVTGYRSALFPRITITPAFFRFIDYAAVWVSGSEKFPALRRLESSLSVHEQPAQLFKAMPDAELFIETDTR